MSFIGYEDLRTILKNNIEPFNEKYFEGTSYQLSLGNEVYVTNSKTGKKEILDSKNTQIDIEPGQFALLLIEEKVTVPKDKLAFIALKFSVKAKGLINISGFHVDPGFSGKLIYSVYNAGASTIVLEKGEPYFTIWFSEIIGKPKENDKGYDNTHEHQNQTSIPPKYIEALKGDLASPNVLLNRIKDAESLKKNQTYVLVTIATVLIGIFVTLCWRENAYKKGYNDGLSDKQAIERIDKILKDKNIDSLIQKNASSVLNILPKDTLK